MQRFVVTVVAEASSNFRHSWQYPLEFIRAREVLVNTARLTVPEPELQHFGLPCTPSTQANKPLQCGQGQTRTISLEVRLKTHADSLSPFQEPPRKGAGHVRQVVSRPGYNPLRRLINHGFCGMSQPSTSTHQWPRKSRAPGKAAACASRQAEAKSASKAPGKWQKPAALEVRVGNARVRR